MEDKILLLLQFGVELIRLWFGMVVIFGASIKRVWCVGVACILFVGTMLFTNINVLDLNSMLWISIILLFVFTVKMPLSKDWKWKLYYAFVLLYQEEIVCIILDSYLYYQQRLFTEYEMELLGSFVALVIIIPIGVVVKMVRRLDGKYKFSIYLRKSMIPLVIFATVEIMIVIILMNQLVGMWGTNLQQSKIMLFNILSMVSIGILFAVVSYVKRTNDKIEYMLVVEKQIREMQLEYYEKLLEKEERTKRYRHDMNNHLICLEDLIYTDNKQEAVNYINKMREHMQSIQNSSYNTGNNVLNALLNYYLSFLDEEVDVMIKGKCTEIINLSEMDMCTIFSNLLKNAVEAIQNCCQQNRFLMIEIEEGSSYVMFRIKNSMKSGSVDLDEEGNFRTTKKDKEDHGMGLLNVKETIKLNGGELQIFIEENQFCNQVILPIKRPMDELYDR